MMAVSTQIAGALVVFLASAACRTRVDVQAGLPVPVGSACSALITPDWSCYRCLEGYVSRQVLYVNPQQRLMTITPEAARNVLEVAFKNMTQNGFHLSCASRQGDATCYGSLHDGHFSLSLVWNCGTWRVSKITVVLGRTQRSPYLDGSFGRQ